MAKIVLIVTLAVMIYMWWRRSAIRAAIKQPARTPTHDEVEARQLLGVGEDADAAAIRAAHRRLISGVHPDRGGSAELARRINAARDTLLKRRSG